MQYLNILACLVTILSFFYRNPKDLLRDCLRFHDSNIGKKFHLIFSFVVSFSILMSAFFLAIGWIIKFKDSVYGIYGGLAIFSFLSFYSMYFLYTSFKDLGSFILDKKIQKNSNA